MTVPSDDELSLERPTIGDMLVTNMPLKLKAPNGKFRILPMGTQGVITDLQDYPNVTMTFISGKNKPLILDLPVNVLLPHYH